jgi:diadenylate cyclase
MEVLKEFRLLDLVDILVVSILIYTILLWFKGSRALQLMKGFLFLLILFVVSKWAGLYTIEWLLQKLAAIFFIVLIVVFQPELRRGLERLGRHFFISALFSKPKAEELPLVNKLVRALVRLSGQKVGALIIVERSTGLNEYVESGVRLDALLSTELLITLFQKKSPLHDGAVLVQEGRVAAASCILPLVDSKIVEHKTGTRHRAALGLTEATDALALVVSEETGDVSIAQNGELTKVPTREILKSELLKRLVKDKK